jgi:AP2 domain.
MPSLKAEQVRTMLGYDPLFGYLYWLQEDQKHRHRPGDPAGTYCEATNVIKVWVDGKLHLAHRLIWLWVYGQWPEHHIDHINGDAADNRLANLRDVSRTINMQNRHKPAKHNKCGLLGVCQRDYGRWRAEVRLNRVTVWSAHFATKEEAYAAYLAAKRRLHVGCTI